uniref:Uncharacterized protein n=1 Tax=viral metagenome TaxID=1070528 RepID=A0A2V0RLF7_9ZZZZ
MPNDIPRVIELVLKEHLNDDSSQQDYMFHYFNIIIDLAKSICAIVDCRFNFKQVNIKSIFQLGSLRLFGFLYNPFSQDSLGHSYLSTCVKGLTDTALYLCFVLIFGISGWSQTRNREVYYDSTGYSLFDADLRSLVMLLCKSLFIEVVTRPAGGTPRPNRRSNNSTNDSDQSDLSITSSNGTNNDNSYSSSILSRLSAFDLLELIRNETFLSLISDPVRLQILTQSQHNSIIDD